MSRSMLVSIVAPRVEEILTMARDEMVRSRSLDNLGAGVVITGGGASMPGMTEIAEEIFAMPVRIGAPQEQAPDDDLALGPKFATAVGLLRYANRQRQRGDSDRVSRNAWRLHSPSRLKEWFQGVF